MRWIVDIISPIFAEAYREIVNQDVFIFFLIGGSYLIFSFTVIVHWLFNVYKSRVAKRLAQQLLSSPALLDGSLNKNKGSIIKRLEKLAVSSRHNPRDFAVAIAAAHMLRHELEIPSSLLLQHIKRKNGRALSQAKSNKKSALSPQHLKTYSVIKPTTKFEIGFLADRLQQNLNEIITVEEKRRSKVTS